MADQSRIIDRIGDVTTLIGFVCIGWFLIAPQSEVFTVLLVATTVTTYSLGHLHGRRCAAKLIVEWALASDESAHGVAVPSPQEVDR